MRERGIGTAVAAASPVSASAAVALAVDVASASASAAAAAATALVAVALPFVPKFVDFCWGKQHCHFHFCWRVVVRGIPLRRWLVVTLE